MTSTASVDWPRAYLLQIYDEVVKQGFIWIGPIGQDDAKSLRQRLYRLRRRADKAMAPYILPEYHLVTVGQWQPENGGRMPVIYNQLPTGQELPGISGATPEELELGLARLTQPLLPAPATVDHQSLLETIANTDLTLEPGEVNDYVNDLIKKAKAKQ